MSAGRNDLDLCPCGNGVKYIRCCREGELELERLVAELEDTIDELGYDTWTAEREWCLGRFAEFYDGGMDGFGPTGPSCQELFEAHLWFLPDCPLPQGQTALWRMRQQRTGRAVELLARSELRAWRIESIGPTEILTGLCPLGAGRARLETIHRPTGDLRPGAVLVARSVPLGPERWALLGHAPVVEASVAAEFEALLWTLDAPRGEVWRVHGGVLARAAWAWPEARELTCDSELVERAWVVFGLEEVERVFTALEADPELDWLAERPDGAPEHWRWRWSPPAARSRGSVPGVRVHLCAEDDDPRQYLAEVHLDRDRAQLTLAAPTEARLALAERLLDQRLGALLGPATSRERRAPNVLPRWKRLRGEQAGHGPEAALAPPGGQRHGGWAA